IRDPDEARELAVDRNEHHGLRLGPHGIGRRVEVAYVDAELGHESLVSDPGLPTPNLANDASSRSRIKIAHALEGELPVGRASEDRLGERMLARPLERCGVSKDLVFAEAGGGDDAHEARLALR